MRRPIGVTDVGGCHDDYSGVGIPWVHVTKADPICGEVLMSTPMEALWADRITLGQV